MLWRRSSGRSREEGALPSPAGCPTLSEVIPDVFKPGDGAFPPALTGREREQAVLTRSLADLSAGEAPPHDIVLTGPRGNGKTVLLHWFERACRDAGGVDVERISPSEVRTRQPWVDRSSMDHVLAHASPSPRSGASATPGVHDR